MNYVTINPRVVFRARLAVFDDEGDRAQKESDIWWGSGETKGKQINGSVVYKWVVSSKEKTRHLQW